MTQTMDYTQENNQALNQLFEIAAQPIPLQQMLGKCLDVLMSLSWLSLLPEAGIFLTSTDEHDQPSLRLVVERNLGPQIAQLCSKVMWGNCLCGRAAATRQPVHASCMDERHEITFPGIKPHGHYNIPILSGDHVLGVMVFYLPDGTACNQQEQDFLVRCAAVISLAIELRRKEMELEAKNRELMFQKKTLDAHAIVSIADPQGNIIYANDKFCQLSGYSKQQLLGKNHRMMNSGVHSPEHYAKLWETIASGDTWHGEFRNKRANGSYFWVEATIVPFMDQTGKPFQYVAVSTDITELKRTEFSLKQAQSVANVGSWSLDLDADHLMWSDEIFNIFGIDPDGFGASLSAFLDTVHPDDLEMVQEKYQGSISCKYGYDIEHRIIRKDNGEVRWVHERCIHQRNSDGKVIRSDGTVQDITDRKQAQLEVQRLAMTDQLTGLANRNQFHQKFEEYLKLARRESLGLALLFIDLDRFKPVNDTYGHLIGDALLREVATTLTRGRRETDIVARLGGDEFAILLLCSTPGETARNIATQLLEKLKVPFSINDIEITIGATIGISAFPAHGEDPDELIHKADVALYAAKNAGRNQYRYYSYDLQDKN